MRRVAIRRNAGLRAVSERGKEHKNLHDKWREVLIAQRGKRCQAAGEGSMRCSSVIQAHHLYSKKTWPALRYDLENGVLVCSAHHEFWVHKAPARDIARWLDYTVGIDLQDRLEYRARASKGRRGATIDLEAVRLFLESQLVIEQSR